MTEKEINAPFSTVLKYCPSTINAYGTEAYIRPTTNSPSRVADDEWKQHQREAKLSEAL
jgi:hypothetical protein